MHSYLTEVNEQIKTINTSTKQYKIFSHKKTQTSTIQFRCLIYADNVLCCVFPYYSIKYDEFKKKVDGSKCIFEENIKGTLVSYFNNGDEWIWSTLSTPIIKETKDYQNEYLVNQLIDISKYMILPRNVCFHFVLSNNRLYFIEARQLNKIDYASKVVTEQYKENISLIENIYLPLRYNIRPGRTLDQIYTYHKQQSRPKWDTGTIVKCNNYTLKLQS